MTYPYPSSFRLLLAVGLVSWGMMGSLPLHAGDSLSVRMSHWVDSLVLDPPLEELSIQDWKPLAAAPTKMFSSYRYYLRLEGYHVEDVALTQWLAVGVFDSLSLYYQDSLSQWHRQEKGLLVDYAAQMKQTFRQFKANKYGFLLTWPVNETRTYYLRIRNTVRFEGNLAQIQLLPAGQAPKPGPDQALGFLVFNAVFFGIFLFFIAFSLIQYTQQGDRAYLFYASYLGMAVLYFWWKFEKANSFLNFLFTDWQEAYYYWEVPLGIMIYLSYFYFVVYFLNARRELPRLYRLIQLSTPLLLIFLGLHLATVLIWDLAVGWELFYWLRFILFPLGFVAIYQVFSTRHRLAFYILSGTTAMLVGGLITSIMSKSLSQHYVGYWDLPLIPIQVGMLIELFFFSTGLAYKGRMMAERQLVLQLSLQQQQAQTNQLRARKQALSQLYARLSHEFRTPLTIIQSALARIKGYQREVGLVQRYSGELLRSVNQVMHWHKLDADQLTVHWVQGDVCRFIRHHLEPFKLLAIRKSQSLSFQGCTESLPMDFDEEKLASILRNLCANAIKYTPEGGTVQICVEKVLDPKGEFLRIAVQDDGPGIALAHQERIFEVYQQVPGSTGGTGLGLALVREFCRQLGGDIHLSSTRTSGSTFTVLLPIHRHAPPIPKWNPGTKINTRNTTDTDFSLPVLARVDRPTILVVEDNPDVAWLLRALLQAHYNILPAANGKEALTKAVHEQPDLVLSDVMMPVMDGIELCRGLRKHRLTQRIPILLLSARIHEADRTAGLVAGADVYLSKPYSEAELLLYIQQLLRPRNGKATSIISTPEESTAASVAFLDKFHGVLLEHLSDSKFKVRDLCRELGINHVSLNKRIRTYTQQSTAQYVRNFRMHQARQLLEETKLSVAEVGYRVGVSEASNFSNLFRKTFGVSPGEWKRQALRVED